MTEFEDSPSESSDPATAALEDFPSATAGPGETLAVTADKTDHTDMDEALHALAEHEPAVDVMSAVEEFPSATAGPGAFLAVTAEHPDHKST